MTRKDYEIIAKAVREVVDSAPTGGTARERQAWRNGVIAGITGTANAIAEQLKRQNPRFRYDTFFEACGLNGWGEWKP